MDMGHEAKKGTREKGALRGKGEKGNKINVQAWGSRRGRRINKYKML